MKIGFVTQPGHAVLPAAGSIEIWADNVARRLAPRHAVTVYASGAPSQPATDSRNGITYRLISHQSSATLLRLLRVAWRVLPPTRPFFASTLHPRRYWIDVAKEARRQDDEVVHVFNYSQALPVLRRFTDAKLVLHMHCEWLTQLDERMIDKRLRHADLIVGCSDYITDKIRLRFPQHATRCMTIYNGVDTDAPPARTEEATSAIQFLNVGRVSPEKGLHVLLDALEDVIRSHPRLELTILGEESPVPYEFAVKISSDDLVKDLGRFYGGSYLQRLRDQMSPELAERVTFVDRVPHEQTRQYYSDADVFVFPSIFEAFPIPPIEAMSAGVPVIASKAGGVVESVVDGRTGLLVERDDPAGLAQAIRRLVEDPETRRSFGAAGRARAVELYAWPRIVDDVEEAFSSLVHPAAGRHSGE
jgi:glycosyltransferase involved in cell wall biosynthesis